MEERFKEADANSDGQLSLDEVQAKMPRLAERFSTLDADKNGMLSKDELQARSAGPHRPAARTAEPDPSRSLKRKAAGPRGPAAFFCPPRLLLRRARSPKHRASALPFALALAFTGEVKLLRLRRLPASLGAVGFCALERTRQRARAVGVGRGARLRLLLARGRAPAWPAQRPASGVERTGETARRIAVRRAVLVAARKRGQRRQRARRVGVGRRSRRSSESERASFTESSEPVRSPAASPFAAPLTPDSEPLAVPAALPAAFDGAGDSIRAAHCRLPLAAPLAVACADDARGRGRALAVSRVLDTRSRTRPVVSRVRSSAPDV